MGSSQVCLFECLPVSLLGLHDARGSDPCGGRLRQLRAVGGALGAACYAMAAMGLNDWLDVDGWWTLMVDGWWVVGGWCLGKWIRVVDRCSSWFIRLYRLCVLLC